MNHLYTHHLGIAQSRASLAVDAMEEAISNARTEVSDVMTPTQTCDMALRLSTLNQAANLMTNAAALLESLT